VSARLGLRLWLVWIVVAFFAVIGYGIADDLGLLEDPTPPSGYATADIPPPYLAWYRRAAEGCPGLSWTVLAAVGKHESDHGRTDLPGVRSGANRAGAAGPMQLGIRGRAGQTWQRYRVDADHDGHISVYDPPDAITAAAAKLCADGAGRQGGLWGALYAYNPSGRYVDRVLRTARRYTGQPSPGPGGGQRPCGGPSAMTLASYRCVPRRGRSRPQPVPLLVSGPPPAGFVQAGLDAYRHTGTRPPWLSEELLRILERRDRLIGVVYLLHFDQLIGDLANPRGFALHYTGRAASSGLLKVLRRADGAEFAELPWVNRMGPPGAPGTPPAPRHRLRVVGGCVLGVVVGTAVLLGTVAAGAVVVGTPTGAVVVDAGPDGDVVDVAGARVAGGIDRSAPATTTPTEVLPPCRGWVPNKLASGWLATVSTPVIATTAIPKASTAATATRCQRIGWGSASLAPSSLTSAWSPTRRTSERRATLWADASEWVYTASAGATSRLTSAAPIRVPSTPKKDATTAPLTAASAPASNLGTRSCSIPHLEVRVGTAALPCGGHGRGRIRDPAAAWRAPTLATQAGSRQVSPSQDGDRAAWGSCSLGDRSFKAALVGRAELQAAQGPGGPEVAHDPAHVGPPRVHQSQRAGTVSDSCAEIVLID